MGLSSIGPGQWLIILLIIVLLFGAKKIPELAKGLGRGIKTFKDEMSSQDEKKDSQKIEEKSSNESFNANEQTVKTEEKKA